ncbi:MerR family transcriptional regulator [Massilia sp. MS-15]|uniref:MerR family transcriptional regulator n=1 Tax=Massilia sp. MS-15 TaxID=2878200 RepID=UPI001CD1F46A|nr:MerR family transcriptional regulator [Massilia sp. MS-15]MCA1246823.1 MerR family transcriptional regulator [Massilia sp. MS-15]
MLSIGELAKQSGASVRALRHYEQSGLLASQRGENGYRRFAPSAVGFVERIRTLLRNGFTLEEIRPVVSMLGPQPADLRSICPEVIALYHSKLDELDGRIEALQQIRASAAARLAFLEEQRRDGGPD